MNTIYIFYEMCPIVNLKIASAPNNVTLTLSGINIAKQKRNFLWLQMDCWFKIPM